MSRIRVLIVDDIWAHGRTMTTVRGRILAAGSMSRAEVLVAFTQSDEAREQSPQSSQTRGLIITRRSALGARSRLRLRRRSVAHSWS